MMHCHHIIASLFAIINAYWPSYPECKDIFKCTHTIYGPGNAHNNLHIH